MDIEGGDKESNYEEKLKSLSHSVCLRQFIKNSPKVEVTVGTCCKSSINVDSFLLKTLDALRKCEAQPVLVEAHVESQRRLR